MSDVDANTDLQALYRELILDHARAPRNFGRLASPTHSAEGINPLCGDKLHLYLNVRDNRLVETRFEGSGCAISMASASLLTETVTNLSIVDAERCIAAVTQRLVHSPAAAQHAVDLDLDKLSALDGVREHPSRIKCATLAWQALQAALSNTTSPATTEKPQ